MEDKDDKPIDWNSLGEDFRRVSEPTMKLNVSYDDLTKEPTLNAAEMHGHLAARCLQGSIYNTSDTNILLLQSQVFEMQRKIKELEEFKKWAIQTINRMA